MNGLGAVNYVIQERRGFLRPRYRVVGKRGGLFGTTVVGRFWTLRGARRWIEPTWTDLPKPVQHKASCHGAIGELQCTPAEHANDEATA